MIYNESNSARERAYFKGEGPMKKFLIAVCAAVLGAACSSGNSNVKTADGRAASNAKNAKYQIIDQEFDNLLAPDADYDTLPAYELQACGDSYLPPAETKLKGTVKPAVKKAAKKEASSAKATNVSNTKKVVNTTNIIYVDDPSQIPVPPQSHSSTTTTTTTSSSAY